MFGDDPHSIDAQGRIDALEARAAEAESWERIKDSADLTAVEAHVARFPTGANAAAAGTLLQHLRRERDAGERWHMISDVSEPETVEQFLVSYPDSAVTAEARVRLGEIRRMREEQDWTAVQGVRHPAPVLHFLRSYPHGVRAGEAFELLASLERTVEEEAWSEVKDSDQLILFKAYLAALPHGKNAGTARTQLQTLAAREATTGTEAATAGAPTTAPTAVPTQDHPLKPSPAPEKPKQSVARGLALFFLYSVGVIFILASLSTSSIGPAVFGLALIIIAVGIQTPRWLEKSQPRPHPRT